MRYFEGFYERKNGGNVNAILKTICKLASIDFENIHFESINDSDPINTINSGVQFFFKNGGINFQVKSSLDIDTLFYPSLIFTKENTFLLLLHCEEENVICWDTKKAIIVISKSELIAQFNEVLFNLTIDFFENWKYSADLPDHLDKTHLLKGNNTASMDENRSIFISVASYRDSELFPTLMNLFERAAQPENIRLYCLNQIDFNRDVIVEELPAFLQKNNVEIRYISNHKSKGVCWARSLIQAKHKNEKYYLQIDSHMRFAQNWDIQLIEELQKCEFEKSIISCYPQSYTPPNTILGERLTVSKPYQFYKDKYAFRGKAFKPKEGDFIDSKPIAHYLISGGFYFCNSKFIKEVPYDPFLYFIGEEADISIRAYTFGWIVFSPSVCLIWHYYNLRGSSNRPLHGDDSKFHHQLDRSSHERLAYKLGITETTSTKLAIVWIEKFPIGKACSIKEFESAVGISIKEKKILE